MQEGDDPMGLPFDWHLRPRRITHLRSNTAQQAPEAAVLGGLGKLSSLQTSMLSIRNSLRKFSMHPVSLQWANCMFSIGKSNGSTGHGVYAAHFAPSLLQQHLDFSPNPHTAMPST